MRNGKYFWLAVLILVPMFASAQKKESFRNTNATVLTTHDSNWVQVTNDTDAVGTIESNRFQVPETDTNNIYYSTSSEAFARLRIVAAAGSDDYRNIGPSVCMGSTQEGYSVSHGAPTSGNYTALNLQKNDAFVESVIFGETWPVNESSTLGIRVDSTNYPTSVALTYYRDGVQVATSTDETPLDCAGTSPGFRVGPTTPNTGIVDEWADNEVTNTVYRHKQHANLSGHWIQPDRQDDVYDIVPSDLSYICDNASVAGVMLLYDWGGDEGWGLETASSTQATLDVSWTQIDNAFAHIAANCPSKKILVFPQHRSFSDTRNYCPDWVQTDLSDDTGLTDRSLCIQFGLTAGWEAKRWDPIVVGGMVRLHRAIHDRYKNNDLFEGTVYQETSIGLTEQQKTDFGYTAALYRDAIIDELLGTAAITNHNVVNYMNFLSDGQTMLDTVNETSGVVPYNVITSGPDILPGNSSLETHVYPRLNNMEGTGFIANSAQNDSYAFDPQVILEYGRDELNLSMITWNLNQAPGSETYNIDDALAVMTANPVVHEIGITGYAGQVTVGGALTLSAEGNSAFTETNTVNLIQNGVSGSLAVDATSDSSVQVTLPTSWTAPLVIEVINGYGDSAKLSLTDGPAAPIVRAHWGN